MASLFAVILPSLYDVIMASLFDDILPSLYDVIMASLFAVILPSLQACQSPHQGVPPSGGEDVVEKHPHVSKPSYTVARARTSAVYGTADGAGHHIRVGEEFAGIGLVKEPRFRQRILFVGRAC